MLIFSDLHRLQRPLRLTSQKLHSQLGKLAAQQKDLIIQGRATSGLAQQRILARQIKRLHEQARQIRQRSARVEVQLDLINRLLLVRESAAAMQAIQQSGLWQQLDWPAVQRELSTFQTTESGQMARLTAVLNLMETAVPTITLPPPSIKPGELYLVERVVDGDTIVIEGGERVRYIGIDCPEMQGWNGRPELFAEKATARNRQLVEGKRVRLEKDVSERDRFGRLLRYVYLGQHFINAQLVREGLAYAFPLRPDTARTELFEKLETEAQRSGRCLWK